MKLVPWVPTPQSIIIDILKTAGLKRGEVLYDLGCGDGRVVIVAVKHFGAKAVGVEIDEQLAMRAVENIKKEGIEEKAEIIVEDMFNVNVSKADVVYMYLLTRVNEMLKKKLERELKEGSRVITLDFSIPGWTPILSKKLWDGVTFRTVNLYVIGVSDKKSIERRINVRNFSYT